MISPVLGSMPTGPGWAYELKWDGLRRVVRTTTGAADEGKGAQNAREAVQDKSAIGYVGEYNSGISKVTIPILNKAGITRISPANTYVGLTSDAPGHEPGVFL